MENPAEKDEVQKRSLPKLLAIGVIIAGLAFLGGLIPMWLSARNCLAELGQVKKTLARCQIEIALGSAAIYARRGDYETARQETSRFFTRLREQVDQGAASALSAGQREKVAPLFSRRDELITLLARSDPASADRLSDLYVAYRKAMTNPEAAGKPGTAPSAK